MRSAACAVLMLCSIGVFAQSPIEEKGDKALDKFELEDALYFYQMAHEQGDESARLTRKIALVYRQLGALETSADWYSRTLALDASNPEDMLYFAEALKILERYEEALSWYKKYLFERPDDSRAQSHVANTRYYRELLADSMRYEFKKLGVNTDRPAFGVCAMDGKMLFSAASISPTFSATGETGEDDPFLDVFVATIGENMELTQVSPLEGEVNSKYHDGPVTFDPETREILVTRNNMKNGRPVRDKKGNVNLKIYATALAGDRWLKATELPFNSDEYSTGHPCISPDGSLLYFVSNKDGGYGGTDIYACERNGLLWGEPYNLGATVNTEGDEMFPFAADGNTLYFASNGHAGLGGLDIFASTSEAHHWSKPHNLGAPINTNHDDFSLYYNPDTEDGYFTSNRSGKGSDDLYYFQNIELTETILAGVIQSPSPEQTLAGQAIWIDRNGARSTALLNETQSFEVVAEAGDHLEIGMVSDEYSQEALLVFDVPESLDEAFTYIGNLQSLLKAAPAIDPQVLQVVNDPRFAHIDQALLEVDVNLLQELLQLKDEMDALEDDPLRKAEIFAEDLSSLEISGIGDYRKMTVTALFVAQEGQQVAGRRAVIHHLNSNLSDTLLIEENGQAAFEVLPGEAFEVFTDAADFDMTIPVFESHMVTRNYTHKVDLGTIDLARKQSGDPAADSGFFVSGSLRSARTAFDLSQHVVTAISGGQTDTLLLAEDGSFRHAVADPESFRLEVVNSDGAAETLWMHRGSTPTQDLNIGTLVLTDADARSRALAHTPISENPNADAPMLRADAEAFTAVASALEFGIAHIYFDSDEDRLRTLDVEALNEAVEVLKANPDWYLEIHAFTDTRGTESYNWKLSEKRALAVQRYMALHGIAGHRLMVDWHGETEQVALTQDQRKAGIDKHQLNRRAEFQFVVPKAGG